ncbi:rna-directed dna polymerase from mobile element jockey-like [Pitangus sulphuratus]|nr:rna-directed dna polymerase from mobile element jockey-like [Pitangus sulphuratus]
MDDSLTNRHCEGFIVDVVGISTLSVFKELQVKKLHEARCCLTNLAFYDKGTCPVEEGKPVDVVYLNFSKTFDTIFPSILLEKLAAHGFDRCTVHWVKNWLES